ncbi:C6 transcription factor (Mut3) [Blumeria hordei DH14]|uniref:C6 transcription factor (Mut3) n=1 Tax=Blumeria graminis f. sp. hordei (strain DH14) TaxID=546991 RepID=N1J8T4_BLUG1|nr:C6 transcription factor (Mut3) [Blumeria hordei DH14]
MDSFCISSYNFIFSQKHNNITIRHHTSPHLTISYIKDNLFTSNPNLPPSSAIIRHNIMDSAPFFINEYTLVGPDTFPGQAQSGGSPRAGLTSQPSTQPSKRRRISRACDECRKRKIKCDGISPCGNCTNYDLGCTYCKPSNRQKRPSRKDSDQLQNQYREALGKLAVLVPEMDLTRFTDGILTPEFEIDIHFSDELRSCPSPQSDVQMSPNTIYSVTPEHQVGMVGSEDDSNGLTSHSDVVNWEFRGDSSGVGSLLHIRDHVNDDLREYISTPSSDLTFDLPSSDLSPIRVDQSPNRPYGLGDLPPFETAEALCETAFSKIKIIYCFIHLPTFYQTLSEVYTLSSDNLIDGNEQYLNLLFSVLALGYKSERKGYNKRNRSGDFISETGVDQGLKYFTRARSAIDVSDCGTIPQLQTVLFLIIYLQSAAKLDVCYSYIKLAQKSALQMGLHLKQNSKCSPIESEVKLRIFWTIQKMDISMSAILGYPKILDLDTIDQELPTEVDDENITETDRNGYPGSTPSASLQAANAHLRLILILDKVIKFMYPNNRVEGSANDDAATAHVVDHRKVREIEEDLRLWCQGLPVSTPSSRSEEVHYYRTQKFLSLAFAHVQMILYRPFLSFVSDNTFVNENKNKISQACASAYFKVCQNIVQIVKDVQKRGIVVGPSWFMINITSFATLSLVYFNCQRSKSSAPLDIHVDASGGLDVAKLIAQRNRDACSYLSAVKAISKQLSLKNSSTNSTAAPPNYGKDIPSASESLPDENKKNKIDSDLRPCHSKGAPNYEPSNQMTQFDESGIEIPNLASNTTQESVSLSRDTSDHEIFEFINFDGDEGLQAETEKWKLKR